MGPRSPGVQVKFPGAQAARLLPGKSGWWWWVAESPWTGASKTEAGI